MKGLKKFLCLALLLLLSVPMLAGCSLFSSKNSGMKRAAISDMEQTNVAQELAE